MSFTSCGIANACLLLDSQSMHAAMLTSARCLRLRRSSEQVLFARQKPHRSTESNDDWKAVMKVHVDCALCLVSSLLECG